jgi:Arc/MetJ-type ribon-helix-helix transcriptional regulator
VKTFTIQCPDRLADRVERLIREGGYADEHEVIIEALRRCVDSRFPESIESQVLADVEWGLHGDD